MEPTATLNLMPDGDFDPRTTSVPICLPSGNPLKVIYPDADNKQCSFIGPPSTACEVLQAVGIQVEISCDGTLADPTGPEGEPALCIVEDLVGIAEIAVDENGRYVYQGNTEVVWDSQIPTRDVRNRILVGNHETGNEWWTHVVGDRTQWRVPETSLVELESEQKRLLLAAVRELTSRLEHAGYAGLSEEARELMPETPPRVDEFNDLLTALDTKPTLATAWAGKKEIASGTEASVRESLKAWMAEAINTKPYLDQLGVAAVLVGNALEAGKLHAAIETWNEAGAAKIIMSHWSPHE